MKLNKGITLSKQHQKVCDRWASFFIPALNAFYPLHTELKFLKPKLSTWRDEALLHFTRQGTSVSVMFYSYSTIDVSIHRSGMPRSSDFLRRFNCRFDENDKLILAGLCEFLGEVFFEVTEKLEEMKNTQQPN